MARWLEELAQELREKLYKPGAVRQNVLTIEADHVHLALRQVPAANAKITQP